MNFFLLYTANAQQSTILIVRPDSKDSKAVTFLDPVNDEEASLKIRDQFKGYNIVEIETDSISKIKGDSRLKDITVSGIVFMGHSNEKQYGLNKEVFYTGESLATAMASSLADTQIADDLIVYFDGCKAGACERDGILREFHENFNEKIDKRKGPTRIYSIGHTNTTEWDKSNPLAAPSALDRIIKKTKIPAALYKVSSGLSTVVGPYSMAATNLLVLATGGAVAYMAPEEAKNIAVAAPFLFGWLAYKSVQISVPEARLIMPDGTTKLDNANSLLKQCLLRLRIATP